jgi:hypothetical protein
MQVTDEPKKRVLCIGLVRGKADGRTYTNNVKIMVIWEVMPCSLVDRYQTNDITSQKTIIFTFTIVKTSNLIYK